MIVACARRDVRAGVLVLLLAAAGASGAVSARDACPQQSIQALVDAALVPVKAEHALVAQACRLWPFDASLALAAVAYALPPTHEGPERTLRLVVAVLDAQDPRPLAVHQTDLGEDAGFALAEGGLRLDTARYDLAPGVRAFGLVVSSSARGASCPDGDLRDALTLFVRQDNTLRPVFSTYLKGWSRVEGEPCSWSSERAVVTDDAALTVGVEPETHHGFADLRVIANVTRTRRGGGSEPEDEVAVSRRTSQVVRYDGARYDVDALQNGFFWLEDAVNQ